ncbi:helix-turn-helix domain-containing protein [Mycolicibacterium tokaiense]|uniref:Putative transcriptional regulator n=1 Tax=Mycolicibacterium tokaiense TaxID=39695 RepID=A0A378TMV5_9MYCO|nr:helix-turn-helix transcriptional regulator [Mycolicibacterium tokaiense]BBY84546.1 transcriptional regulator [Mycolicibacterium tokaiense]STZ60946.1 putative transcriptional regulator [Mycolicibacterium tokaiense]
MATKPNHLGEYLRARRGLVSPTKVGIVDTGDRRVPGLRREEVAMLAGISADYYLRLERGRDRNPSTQVLEAIANALQLDEDNADHLLSLAADRPRRTRRRTMAVSAPASILGLLPQLALPAFVENNHFDVLASNAMAAALSPRLVAGRNQLQDMFCDPEEIALHPDWDGTTECLLSSLRHSVGTDIDDPLFVEFVDELSLASPRFRNMWDRHDVGAQSGAPTLFDHPTVGRMHLYRERLAVAGAAGVHLVVYHPEAGSPDAHKLTLLAATPAPAHAPAR